MTQVHEFPQIAGRNVSPEIGRDIGAAMAMLRENVWVRRATWVEDKNAPVCLVLVAGRRAEAILGIGSVDEAVGDGNAFRTRQHIDALYCSGNGAEPEVVVGYQFTQQDILAEDWCMA